MKKKTEKQGVDELEMNLNEVLDKLLLVQEKSRQPSFLKRVIYIVTSICVCMFVGLICLSIYKNNFSSESILSTFLAFFSIFISIFFYFKADETSTKFYDASYKFMKDISVTLGKIEERFGEKLNSLNDKVSHLDKMSKDAGDEIEEKKQFNDVVSELMKKAQLTEEERNNYERRIEENEAEIAVLKRSQAIAQREADRLRHYVDMSSEENLIMKKYRYRQLLLEVLEKGEIPEDLSIAEMMYLRNNGYINQEGAINKTRVLKGLEKMRLQ